MYVPNIFQFEMENYKLFILDERLEKVTTAFSTAKKQSEDIEVGEYFPPEGSSSILFCVSDTGEEPEVHGLFFGGARYKDQIRTTGVANHIFGVDFTYDENVVSKYSDV